MAYRLHVCQPGTAKVGAVEGATRQADRSEATRRALVAAARELFAARGYAAVGTEEVVRSAGVTRGALYHHFDDKRDLFRAVYEAVEEDLVGSIGEAMGSAHDPWTLLVTGVRRWLEACADPAVMRISLIDAPAVLGWQEWREISARYGLELVALGLEGAMEAGVLRRQPVKPLAHLLLGAMSEAGMVVAAAGGDRAAREEVEEALLALMEGLRA